LARYGAERADRCDVEHRSPSALDHVRDEPAAEVDHRGDVDLDQVEFGLRVRIGDWAQCGKPRIVDQDLRDDTERRDLVGQRGTLVAIRQIGGQDVRPAVEFFRQGPQPVGSPGHEDQSVTAAGEFAGDLLADTG
jgi:hypothetical protein